MEGYIYILTHDRMPGLVKIGYTTQEVTARLADINAATGVPGNFKEFCSFKVEHAHKVEKAIHEKLRPYRYISCKEFFVLPPETARQYVSKIIEGADFGIQFDAFDMSICESPVQLGALIKRHRKLKKITQRDLATVAGCGLRFIVDVEKGKTTSQIGKIFSLLKALNIKIAIDFPVSDRH